MTNSAAAGATGAQAAAQTIANIQAVKAQTAKTNAETNQVTLESALRVKQLQLQNALTNISAQWADQEHLVKNQLDRAELFSKGKYNDLAEQIYAAQLEQLRANILGTTTSAREASARTDLLRLERPEAENRARAQGSWYMKHFAPYVNNAAKAVDTINRVIR